MPMLPVPRYIRYMETARDRDGDGMYEWGPYGIIENVRDGWNVVFQLFSEGTDEGRDISHELEVLDLTAEMANEMYSSACNGEGAGRHGGSARMVGEVRQDRRADQPVHVGPAGPVLLQRQHGQQQFCVRRCESETEGTHRVPARSGPMWPRRNRRRTSSSTSPITKSFWRTFGVPTLAANDPQYTPFVDGCCRWNGPVWLLWDYIVMRGLRNYGYHDLANQVGSKLMDAVSMQLSINHHFWESYSPDYPVQESPSNYIWDAIMAKVLLDMYAHK